MTTSYLQRRSAYGTDKDRRLAAMQKQQRAILLRQGYGGLKAGMKLPTPKQARKSVGGKSSGPPQRDYRE